MKYSVDRDKDTPAYMQLYLQLRADIQSGAIGVGSRLPSKRLLAAETGVSVITVEHGYELLSDEGYAEARERSGYFAASGAVGMPPVKPVSIESMRAEDIPADFPFSVYARTMRRVLSKYDSRILSRGENMGCIELRCALSGYLARSRGIKTAPEQIVIGSGAEYLYSLVFLLCGRDRKIALEDPSYEKIRKVYETSGADCELLALGEDGIISAELEKSGAGILHVTPYHSYPSGVTASTEKRREYAAWAERKGAYIVEDDYDSEFSAKPVETVFSIAPERVIYVNSFSKTIAPSIRTGYMVLPEALAAQYRERLGFLSCTVPVFEQLVLAEFITTGDMERYINRRRRKQRQNAHGSSERAMLST